MYLSVRSKFSITLTIATLWFILCTYISWVWIATLAEYIGYPFAIFIVLFIALIPGFMYMFLFVAYLLDNRPLSEPLAEYPPVTYLIAAYNEAAAIEATIQSIQKQDYKGQSQIIIVDDGSTDNTRDIIKRLGIKNLTLIENEHGGKANCLNTGLQRAEHEFLICLDADTYLLPNATSKIIERYHSDPQGTVAVAGSVLVKNSRNSFMTRLEEWDFFLSITAIKRMQSLFQGTLVAQGAFSLYLKSVVSEVGGWKPSVGEDIVLSWTLLKKKHRIGFAEDAIAFTDEPTSYKSFFSQRKRWARGLIEAFSQNPDILIVPRFTLLLIYWNLLFPILDCVYIFIFVPGIILAFMGYFFIAGPMTLAVLPLTLMYNFTFYRRQKKVFDKLNLKIRKNYFALVIYLLFYQFMMAPAAIAGYIAELLRSKKNWGTK